MTGEPKAVEENELCSCYVTYKAGLFLAYSFDYDKRYYTPREVDEDLEGLLLKCKKAGFNHLDGLTTEAIHAVGGIEDSVGDFLKRNTKETSVLDYVEELWQSGVYSVRHLGHRAEGPEDKEPEATKADLERYGIKSTRGGGRVVTNEMVNKLRDELGV